MKVWGRRLTVALLFAALVVVLLWFQGLLFRHEPELRPVPGAPAVDPGARRARVERRVLPRVQVLPGFVEAIDPAPLSPRVMGAILSLEVREGDRVEEGQTLVVLDDRDARAQHAQAEAGRAAAEARALEAELAFDRAQRLLEARAQTEGEWERARATRDAARAEAARAEQGVAQATTALSWFTLRAPFTGRVLARQGDPGELATPGRPLLVLYREQPLRFSVAVPEERAAVLEPGSEHALDFEPLSPRQARVTRVLPPADPATGTVTVHLEIADATALRPGQLGRIALEVGEREVLVVPRTAVERIGQVERVRLVRAGVVVSVTVRSGKLQGEDLEVLSGLSAGEEVLLP